MKSVDMIASSSSQSLTSKFSEKNIIILKQKTAAMFALCVWIDTLLQHAPSSGSNTANIVESRRARASNMLLIHVYDNEWWDGWEFQRDKWKEQTAN